MARARQRGAEHLAGVIARGCRYRRLAESHSWGRGRGAGRTDVGGARSTPKRDPVSSLVAAPRLLGAATVAATTLVPVAGTGGLLLQRGQLFQRLEVFL